MTENSGPDRRRIQVLDTTLRDGAQGEGISFSVNDKFAVMETLVSLGVDYIEAGNPGSNPKDREFFALFAERKPGLGASRLCAFGSTRRKDTTPETDPGLRALLDTGAETLVIFGKVWLREVHELLRCRPEENLAMLEDSIRFLVSHGREAIFDAEHFFEAFADDADYAVSGLAAAARGGASVVVLCDTNGATMPDVVEAATAEVIRRLPGIRVGIHCHNDCGLAVACSMAAVRAGADHVQGTFNGIGERCGNANLSTLIPNLQLKWHCRCLPDDAMPRLTPAARRLAEIANLHLPNGAPFVGQSAFTHKAGMHVDGVIKNPTTFEHVPPESVGNVRRFLMSEISGRTAVLSVIRRIRPDLDKNAPQVATVLERLKALEHEGYHFEGAEASLELIVCKELGLYTPFFQLEKMRIMGEQPVQGEYPAQAFIKIHVDGETEVTAAEGDGPVNAMDQALRKALEVFYPELARVQLTDFKVRVIDSAATASKVRVLIETSDGEAVWTTVGVSTDILEASWLALVDSLEYRLMRQKLEATGGTNP